MEKNQLYEPNLNVDTQKIYPYIAIKIFFTLFVGCTIVTLLYHFGNTSIWIEKFSSDIKDSGIIGVILITVVIAILISISLPMEPIVVSMAYFISRMYGNYIGSILTLAISLAATEISSLLSVVMIRNFLSQSIKDHIVISDLYSALNLAVKEKGLLLVLLVRLTPIVPFAISNYALGLTEISYSSLFIGNLGCTPIYILLILLGVSIPNIETIEDNRSLFRINSKHGVIIVSIALFSVITIFYIIIGNYRRIKEYGLINLQKDPEESQNSSTTPFYSITGNSTIQDI